MVMGEGNGGAGGDGDLWCMRLLGMRSIEVCKLMVKTSGGDGR